MRPALIKKRFASKLRQDGECLAWTGCVDRDGYGETGGALGERKAHRTAWVLAHGPIPDGMSVLHRCDNPPCCAAAHLFLGTPKDNMRDRHAKGRYATGPAHHWSSRPETVRRGERHPAARLTDAQVREIRAIYVDRRGEQSRLARKYGVCQGTIWRIVRNAARTEA